MEDSDAGYSPSPFAPIRFLIRVIGSDHDDEFDDEIEEFRRRLESLGGPLSPQPMRARVTLSPTLLGLKS